MNYSVTVIADYPTAYYSGMLPGAVAGMYSAEDIQIKVDALCQWSGCRFINQEVVRLDPDAQIVYTKGTSFFFGIV